jgi:hypothetical protein
LEIDPGLGASDTGPQGTPTTNWCPIVEIPYIADTTRIPYINIYRSTDGGGTFFFNQQVPNTYSGVLIFTDKYRPVTVSGTITYVNPIPDANLDTSHVAPSETSNLPPPPVTPPKVSGSDQVEHSSPIVSYAGRLWYGIGSYLYYSGQEEIATGVPEEAWPGGLGGNFYKMPHQVTNLLPNINGLYVYTPKGIHRVIGSDRDTFSLKPLMNDVGHPTGHPRAACVMEDSIAWLTNDYRIATVENGALRILSGPLYRDIVNAVENGATMHMIHFTEAERHYLFVMAVKRTVGATQWVCDLSRTEQSSKEFWYPPWDIQATAMLSDSISMNNPRQRMVFAMSNWITGDSQLNMLGETTRTGGIGGGVATFVDPIPGTTARPISFFYDTYLMTAPPGNHVNMLNIPARVTTALNVEFDRTTQAANDFDPDVYVFYDDLWSVPGTALTLSDPPRRPVSTGYKTRIGQIDRTVRRVAIRVAKDNAPAPYEQHNLILTFDPTRGG